MGGARCDSLAFAAARTLIVALAVLSARPLLAQNRRFNFTQTGGPLTFVAPTAADFAAGFALHPTGLTFQVDVANNAHPTTLFETTVSVRATTPTLGRTGKPTSDLEWSSGGAGGPWRAPDHPVRDHGVRARHDANARRDRQADERSRMEPRRSRRAMDRTLARGCARRNAHGAAEPAERSLA